MVIPTWLPSDLREAARDALDVIQHTIVLINMAKMREPAKSTDEFLAGEFRDLSSSAQKARESVKKVWDELLFSHMASSRNLPSFDGVEDKFAAALAVAVGFDVINRYCEPFGDKLGNWGYGLRFDATDKKFMEGARKRIAVLVPPDYSIWETILAAEAIDAAQTRACPKEMKLPDEAKEQPQAEGNDQGGDEDTKDVAAGLQWPKLTAKQKEQMRVTMEESMKKIRAGAQALRDKQDEYQRGIARVDDTIASIEPTPRVDTEILEELRKLNAAQQGQLPDASATADDDDKRPRCAPMSRAEIARRLLNKPSARTRDANGLMQRHGLRQEPGSNLWTICIDKLDPMAKDRMSKPLK